MEFRYDWHLPVKSSPSYTTQLESFHRRRRIVDIFCRITISAPIYMNTNTLRVHACGKTQQACTFKRLRFRGLSAEYAG